MFEQIGDSLVSLAGIFIQTLPARLGTSPSLLAAAPLGIHKQIRDDSHESGSETNGDSDGSGLFGGLTTSCW